jgi:aspartate-semialdehyde dehydrogenase
LQPNEARELLRNAPGVHLVDDPAKKLYPMPLTASQKYAVEVGRVRRNLVFGENVSVCMFVCA